MSLYISLLLQYYYATPLGIVARDVARLATAVNDIDSVRCTKNPGLTGTVIFTVYNNIGVSGGAKRTRGDLSLVTRTRAPGSLDGHSRGRVSVAGQQVSAVE